MREVRNKNLTASEESNQRMELGVVCTCSLLNLKSVLFHFVNLTAQLALSIGECRWFGSAAAAN
jgi:hypothetical protein